jgi:release factor glutamine methyltransferase
LHDFGGEKPAKLMKTMRFLTESGAGGVPLRQAVADGTIQLQQAGIKTPTRDAELLLLHLTGLSRTDLLTQPERQLSPAEVKEYHELIGRRAQSEPVQYITGEREFYGLRFVVTPDVLIPRPETEHLVEEALERIPSNASFHIADVGTGSGAIAVAIAVARPSARITAIDFSSAALQIARQNASAHKVTERIEFVEANLLEGIATASCDMVVSNPPYIAIGERETLDVEVREFEPVTALFAGPTGMEIYDRLIPQAAIIVRQRGWLLLEIGVEQQLQLSRLLKDWSNVSFVPDLQGIPRVALAQRP